MNDGLSTLDAQDAVFPVRFIVQSMALFRESLAQWAPERRDGSQNENGMILAYTSAVNQQLTMK
jgi:hypothetical protein